MNLQELGFYPDLNQYIKENNLSDLEIGRIVAEFKERYTVKLSQGEYEAEITGNIRFSANNREDFPAVGDWVALKVYENSLAIIHKVLPRYSVLKRAAIGSGTSLQIIAANIDAALIMLSVGRDFNVNRIERYLTICYSAAIKSFVIITKADLVNGDELNELVVKLRTRLVNVPVLPLSNKTEQGYSQLMEWILPGNTYCLLGSSGVGKSTLINKMVGTEKMKTEEISKISNRGKHVTTHRELIILKSGGILIDNPGMREIGIADNQLGLEETFDGLIQFSKNCRYANCSHTNEPGCGVLDALNKGLLNAGLYHNYMKLKKEEKYFQSSVLEKRQKDRDFGKMMKNYKKIKGNAK
jgi:ribosome biogenesis GTPase / thiamine phosphate phosphatase